MRLKQIQECFDDLLFEVENFACFLEADYNLLKVFVGELLVVWLVSGCRGRVPIPRILLVEEGAYWERNLRLLLEEKLIGNLFFAIWKLDNLDAFLLGYLKHFLNYFANARFLPQRHEKRRLSVIIVWLGMLENILWLFFFLLGDHNFVSQGRNSVHDRSKNGHFWPRLNL